MHRLLYILLLFVLMQCSAMHPLRSYKQGEVIREVPGNTQVFLDFYDERPSLRVGEVTREGEHLVYTESGLRFSRRIQASEVAQIRVEKDEGDMKANLTFSGMSLLSGMSLMYFAPMLGGYAEMALFYGTGVGFTGVSMLKLYEAQHSTSKRTTIRVHD